MKEASNRKLNSSNKGMTLIEIIVVIAIIAILMGAATYAISFAFSKDCENSARTIDTQLANLRERTMVQTGDFTMKLTLTPNVENTVQIMDGSSVIENEKISGRVTVECYLDGVLHNADWIEIKFSKSSGKVSSIVFSDGAVTNLPAVLTIRSSNKDGKVREVQLVSLTGKHYVD